MNVEVRGIVGSKTGEIVIVLLYNSLSSSLYFSSRFSFPKPGEALESTIGGRRVHLVHDEARRVGGSRALPAYRS